MSELRFSDGMSIDTGGFLRVVHKPDGWYVVGRGLCAAVDSRKDGENLIEGLNKIRAKWNRRTT